jgi:hypothetical protein
MDLTNKEASALFRNCDISTRNSIVSLNDRIVLPFGGIPVQWALDPGPIFVVRLDYKPLHPLHAAAICAFCTRYIRAAFQDCFDTERAISTPGSPRGHMRERSNTSIAAAPSAPLVSPNMETIYERRRAVLAHATSGSFAEFFESYKAQRVRGRPDLWGVDEAHLDHMQRMERWNVPPDELEPRPEWEDVPSPFDV